MITKTTLSHQILKSPVGDALHRLDWVTLNDIENDILGKFCQQFDKVSSLPQTIVPVLVDSYGGSVYDCLGIVDLIERSEKPVATITLSKAMSAGGIILGAGTKGYRFASPNSTIMIHEVSSWAMGKTNDIKADADESERLNNLLLDMLARFSDKPKNFYAKLIRENGNADLYITPRQALNYGLIDKIGTPTFEMNVKVTYSLK